MKKVIMTAVVILTMALFVACEDSTENDELFDKSIQEQATEPDDDGTTDPPPMETGNEGG